MCALSFVVLKIGAELFLRTSGGERGWQGFVDGVCERNLGLVECEFTIFRICFGAVL